MTAPRIGFDAVRALRNRTGLGSYSRGVLAGLRRANPALPMHLYSPRTPRPEFAALPETLGAELHLPPRRWQRFGVRAIWRTFDLGRDAATDAIDLYHGLSHEIPRDLPATGIRSVVTFHDLIYEAHPGWFPIADRWSYRWRYRWSARHATAVVAVSARTRQELIDRYEIDPSRIAVVPPARNPAFAAPIPAPEREAALARYGLPSEYLLSVGTLEARKNHAVLVAAMALLPPTATLPLILVGRDGGEGPALRRAIAAAGLDRRVRILTTVSAEDLPALVQSAAIALYPSRIEGFGMPIVEGQSAGIPVIAAAGGHLHEAGGSAARYADPENPAAWAETIASILGNSSVATAMRRDGAAHARRFDGDRLAPQLLAIYDAVLTGAQLPATTDLSEASMERIR
ncbi:MAG TPA: glycosyltransferase family 1 protein [Gemmatimonadales bacterium]